MVNSTAQYAFVLRYIFKKKAGGVLQMPDKLDGHLLSEDLALMTATPQQQHHSQSSSLSPVADASSGAAVSSVVGGPGPGDSGVGVAMAPRKADHSRPCSEAKIIHKEQVRVFPEALDEAST